MQSMTHPHRHTRTAAYYFLWCLTYHLTVWPVTHMKHLRPMRCGASTSQTESSTGPSQNLTGHLTALRVRAQRCLRLGISTDLTSTTIRLVCNPETPLQDSSLKHNVIVTTNPNPNSIVLSHPTNKLEIVGSPQNSHSRRPKIYGCIISIHNQRATNTYRILH